ncbi:hypothetical protein ACFFK0_29370 [Paenibacillus chartarius]|uniref:Uncharacterized protein n=1 Tax=Paenibacillus chartarius TaxID=747481 RepID=A0ABV6DVF0_9BACL
MYKRKFTMPRGAALFVLALTAVIPGPSCTLSAAASPASARTALPAPDRIGSLKLHLARAGSEAAMLGRAVLIVQAHPAGTASAHDTGRTIGGLKVEHYVQKLTVIDTLKGRVPADLRLVLPGVEPLPPAKDPLNAQYPGPLAEDVAYMLFLEPAGLPGMYTTVGGWQGIYPLNDEGRTVSLEGAGFPQLGGLTPAELKRRLRTSGPGR